MGGAIRHAMKISFSAADPCHLWPVARAVREAGVSIHFYSGSPASKLPCVNKSQTRFSISRTLAMRTLLYCVPPMLRANAGRLRESRDYHFDAWVAGQLAFTDFIHALPGQALKTFRAAKNLGIRTVLNHARIPAREWARTMRPEYERAGMRIEQEWPCEQSHFAREDEEYALADFHCAPSGLVRDFLLARGVAHDRVWTIPHGADVGDRIFTRAGNASPPPVFRVLYAGEMRLHNGMRTLLDALKAAQSAHWQMDFIGERFGETDHDFGAYRGVTPLTFHGRLSDEHTARAMRDSSVLVLPSLTEGFGLAVTQALNCGCPCIVSDGAGAHEWILQRENGSVFPAGDSAALAEELKWWERNPARATANFTWVGHAHALISHSEQAEQSGIHERESE